jgi:hypothetical protein
MKKSDVLGHRTRSTGVYYNIANEIIAAPLLKGRTSYTDVITLIEMRDDAIVNAEIHKEPISWSLYNKVVQLAKEEFRASSHGNYLPALEKAYEVLLETEAEHCAQMLFFLSDGSPSDSSINKMKFRGLESWEVWEYYAAFMVEKVTAICSRFKTRLTFGCFGFANSLSDFTLLQQFVTTAKLCGVKQAFFQHGLDSSGLRALLSTLVTSLTDTRTMLSSMVPTAMTHTKVRRPGMIPDTLGDSSTDAFLPHEWDMHTCEMHYLERKDLVKDKRVLKGDVSGRFFKPVPLYDPAAVGIAVKKRFIGEGAERVVYEMTEIDANTKPVGQPLVVKIKTADIISSSFTLFSAQLKKRLGVSLKSLTKGWISSKSLHSSLAFIISTALTILLRLMAMNTAGWSRNVLTCLVGLSGAITRAGCTTFLRAK